MRTPSRSGHELPSRLGAARLAAHASGQPAHAAPRRRRAGVDEPRRRAHVGAAGAHHRPGGRADGPGRGRRAQAVLRRCEAPVGRARGDQPGRTKGFCPKCRTPFDFDPRLQPGDARRRPVRGRRLPRPRRDGLDLPRPRPQRERSLGRAQGPAQHRRPRRVPGRRQREAVPRRGRAPADRRDLQLRHRPRRRVVHRHGVRRRHVAQRPRQVSAPSRRRRLRAVPGRPGDRLHRRGAPGVLLPAHDRPALLRLQAGQRDPGRRERQADRPRRRAAHRRRRDADLRHRRLPGPRGAPRRHHDRLGHLHRRAHAGRAGVRVPRLDRRVRRPLADARRGARCSPSTTRCTGCSCGRRRPAPEDRFQSADELREQLLGVLREVTSRDDGDFRSVPSTYFDTPAISGDELGWAELPALRVDAHRPDGVVAERRHVRRPGPPAGAARRRRPSRRPPSAWPGPGPRSASATSARAKAECEALLAGRSVGLAGRVDERVCRAGQRRRRRGGCRRSTPSTASCPASWPRSWRWRGPASWPTSARSPAACTPCARGPTAPTSRRPSSAWPAWPSPTAARAMRSPRWPASHRSAGRTASRGASGRRCWSTRARPRRTTSPRRPSRSTGPGCHRASGRRCRSRSSRPR